MEGQFMANVKNPHRAGYVAVIGRPNVGKSTLINTLLGQKIAAVSPRPQTTRRRQLGILTLPEAQIVFVDTPGLHIPQHKLGEFMNSEAADSLQDADGILWLVDTSDPLTEEDRLIADRLAGLRREPKILIVMTKADTVSAEELDQRSQAAGELLPGKEILSLSAFTHKGVDELLQKVIAFLPEGENFYDPDTVTDYYERDIAGELIRESALIYLRDEVPHCLAVRLDQFKERDDQHAYIEATLFVERESHKGIVIGQGGEMLKKIGTRARQEIEAMSGRKVYLDLHVKVNKNWRNSPEALKLLGYASAKE
jgi:GTP-binding protein Era